MHLCMWDTVLEIYGCEGINTTCTKKRVLCGYGIRSLIICFQFAQRKKIILAVLNEQTDDISKISS